LRPNADWKTDRLRIAELGQHGDGIALGAQGRVFVPYTLPGETVLATTEGERGRLIAVETTSPERVTPPCPLFGTCGGCALQHWAAEPTRAWKRAGVAARLAAVGLTPPVAPPIDATQGGRRRATFHARREHDAIVVGFMAARSHDLVPVPSCPVLAPALAGAPLVARRVAEALGGAKPLDIQVTATDGGLAIDVRGHGPVEGRRRSALSRLADDLDLARLSLHGDIVVERRSPLITMGMAQVVPPPGGFLQATQAGEAALARLVVEAVGSGKKVADLFSGCGPFALRLAQSATVHAVELEKAALAALDTAARRTQGLRQITTEARDLLRRPLLGPELAGFDAVVMDPPRAGAQAMATALAAAQVPLVVYVSCDAVTFARDAAILVAGGYRLDQVTPVDQFAFSPHIEIVGQFSRPPPKRRRSLLR
jgi:23S rRNA (uracil1939-C5)-methyltransferase